MEYICIGKIINTHGIKGELKIQSYSDFDSLRYKKGNVVYVFHDDAYIPFVVQTFRSHKGNSLVSFKDQQDINLVEKYKNCCVFIEKDSRRPLGKGKYYRDQIRGLKAYNQNGEFMGIVISVEETKGAQNNIRIQKEDGAEFLVPFINEFIGNVDLEKQILMVKIQEGLL